MIIVLTFVPVTRMPWITSGVAKRRVTGRFAGTRRHCGWKANCVATIRLVTWPEASTLVPRLPSVNSPVRCRVLGSTVSILLGGLMLVTTPPETAAQPSSDLRIACSVAGMASAHRASGQEHEDVHQEPGEQQQPDGQPRQRQRAARHLRHDALHRLVVDLVRRRVAANPRRLGKARGRHAISRSKYPWSGASMRGGGHRRSASCPQSAARSMLKLLVSWVARRSCNSSR